MVLTVNGEQKEVTQTLSVAGLLVLLKVESPDMVSVQLNQEFVDREVFEETWLKDKDEVDFLYFMGGGAA